MSVHCGISSLHAMEVADYNDTPTISLRGGPPGRRMASPCTLYEFHNPSTQHDDDPTTTEATSKTKTNRRARTETTAADPAALEAFRSIETVRQEATNVTRLGIINAVHQDHNNETIGICHIATLLPLSILLAASGQHSVPYAIFGAGGLAASALAIEMLNSGDASIVPELANLPENCPLRFTLEAWDLSMNPGFTVAATNELLARDTAAGDREVCAFLGTGLSAGTVPMAILTGIAGRPQLR